jgi:hypothetical protein
MRFAALVAVVVLAGGCSDRQALISQQARVRNQPPTSCTQADFNRCAAPATQACDANSEPVIDYGSDCCPILSCQPLCAAPQQCPMQPAPNCAGSELQVGTNLSDCCPTYRCINTQCNDARWDSTNGPAACSTAVPYCGAGIQPAIVGETADCCPIYQCPCVTYGESGAPAPGGATDMTPSNAAYCGCTYPTCAAGEQLVCAGSGPCGSCACQPLTANCTTDADCGPNLYCDTTSLALTPPGCDPTTGACPGTGGGVCVAAVASGCKADTECPSGQRCELACAGYDCAGGSGATPCCNPATDPYCTCDAAGNCQSQTCTGQCAPAATCTTQAPAAACAPAAMPCANPIVAGLDPTTCCPIYQCPSGCLPQAGVSCAVPGCACGGQVGLDENCCPIYVCPSITTPGVCPTVCASDAACAAGQTCVNNVCQ